jgi:leucyl aminopeptidase
MTDRLDVIFAALDASPEPVMVGYAGAGLALGHAITAIDERSRGAVHRAAEAAEFTGKAKTTLEVLAPTGTSLKRMVLIGCGAADEAKENDIIALGGQAMSQILSRKAKRAAIVAELPGLGGRRAAEAAADMALGAALRHYDFGKYKTSKPSDADEPAGDAPVRNGMERLVVHCPDPDAARAAYGRRQALADGIYLARDLVNEPANVMGPVELAEATRSLERAGVEVTILDEKALAELKMGALLGVAQGSPRPPRVVVMQWHGAKSKRTRPVAFIGKGVVFDTGGISIKPSAGMEDMKGDMAGAAAVVGAMLALAGRKANVNAVGLIGIVENMPSGSAQRPGDIVTSMSGQTIEVLNTDAEGRLVLADVIHYAQQEFKPKLMVDLATLTGAVIVALGKEHAGLFCNDDKLAAELIGAGEATGEKVWRMPLGRAYDKLIDSRSADMKNIGGRWGGAIIGAQFIQRFVKDTPWAHLDVAGVAFDSAKTDISQGWASGWGVRLLDRLVADHHEKS